MTFRAVPVLASLLVLTACGDLVSEPIVIGTNNTTEQRIIGEIIAQHLENRTGEVPARQLGLGTSEVLYPAMISGQLAIFPDYTGEILTTLLDERPSADPGIAFARAQGELAREASVTLLDPLGYDARYGVVISDSDPRNIMTISQAVQAEPGWKLGVTRSFQASEGGLPQLNLYRLPLAAPTRAMDLTELFPAMREQEFDMLAVRISHAELGLGDWRILEDDQGVFYPQEAVILMRSELDNTHPQAAAALRELSGKIDLATIRRLNAAVDIEERTVPEVASEFLASAGLN